jgi:hypothetical protein
MQTLRREDFFEAMTLLNHPRVNPYQGSVDLRILQAGSLWVTVIMSPQQIATLTAAGIAVSQC